MSPWRNRPLLTSMVFVGLLAACGSGDGESSASGGATTADLSIPSTPFEGTLPAAADPTFCEPMRNLANYNAQSELDPAADWATLQQQLAAAQQESVALYGEAIATAPEEVRDNLETLNAFSEQIFTAAADATSLEQFGETIGTPPPDVLTATQELNTYIQEACGFALTGTG